MIKGEDLLLDLEEQMQTIKLPLMALKLDEIYRSPDYLHMDKLDFLSALLAPEFKDKVTKTINNRLRTAHIIGTPCEIASCRDSKRRQYEPTGAPKTLSSLRFVEEGQNVCILGASDSGKTYLAKALGAEACREFRVAYYHCDELVGDLAAMRKTDYPKYKKKLQALTNLDLVILDDFLLHPITEDDEVKGLYDILERRNEMSRSCIICSQRDPKAWPSMLMEDEVSSNSLLKRVTRHYNVMIERKVAE